MRNAIWNAGRKLMFGTALVAGLLGAGAVAANAAPFRGAAGHEYGRENGREYGRGFDRPVARDYGRGYGYGYRPGFGVAIGAPVVDAYIPPCPGDGYVWFGGAWVFRGRAGYGYGRDVRFDRGFDHGYDRGRGLNRGYDRGYRGRR